MTDYPYFHVDAFASRPFEGNQAAIIPLSAWLPDETLLAIAEENNFAETAYLVPDQTGQAEFELRWFTPTSEVALCGHATLASGHLLLSQDSSLRAINFRTRKAGILRVSRAARGYDMALPATFLEPREHPELLAALGLTDAPVYWSVRGAEDTAIVALDHEIAVHELQPDLKALGRIDVMAIVTAPGAPGDDGLGTDVVSRVFVPAWGVDEDSVTGSAHCALATFWAERLGRDRFTAYQASARGGHVGVRLDGDRAILTGECVTVVEGVFRI